MIGPSKTLTKRHTIEATSRTDNTGQQSGGSLIGLAAVFALAYIGQGRGAIWVIGSYALHIFIELQTLQEVLFRNSYCD